jgi:hypothetical protein
MDDDGGRSLAHRREARHSDIVLSQNVMTRCFLIIDIFGFGDNLLRISIAKRLMKPITSRRRHTPFSSRSHFYQQTQEERTKS